MALVYMLTTLQSTLGLMWRSILICCRQHVTCSWQQSLASHGLHISSLHQEARCIDCLVPSRFVWQHPGIMAQCHNGQIDAVHPTAGQYLSYYKADRRWTLDQGREYSWRYGRQKNIQYWPSGCVLVTDTEVISCRLCLRKVELISIPKSIQHPQIIWINCITLVTFILPPS